MNKGSIKNYAIWARNELIQRVTQKTYEYGVEKDNIIPANEDSIRGRLLSFDEKRKRSALIREVNYKGYDQVIEEVAYTWFNRFIALRFMEVNNYLPNKVRLFTNENNEFKPQILDEALNVEIPGLDQKRVFELYESNNSEELYKELLLATCNDMHQYLPGMFETIDDYKGLLFPNNLLRESSVLGRLISDIEEESWTDQVQIIGWLYQYYNTEPKDKVYARKSGTKIKKEEIPVVTQLFTPDWIVRYMTENSLGRLWLDGHEDKGIKSSWKYYLDEAEQEQKVQVDLNKIKAEHAKLKPEDIKFIDPCMGSGHILVYAFDVLMQIYVSEGWTEREAAKSILKNNLYGLDIDERAYQLSYFALMMKARQYNRRILSEGITPNVMAIEESNTFNRDLLVRFGDELKPIATRLIDTFVDAKEYGSILNVEFTEEELNRLDKKLDEIYKMADYGSLLVQAESYELVEKFDIFLKQARIMSSKYDCVVTNPPYNPVSNCDDKIQNFIKLNYPDSKTDFFAVFMEKAFNLLNPNSYYGMINMHSWMFLSSYESLRNKILTNSTIINMAHLGARAFEEIGGEVVQTTAFVTKNTHVKDYKGKYSRLIEPNTQSGKEKLYLEKTNIYIISTEKFSKIPGSLIVYWGTDKMINTFNSKTIEDYASTNNGFTTGDNNRFLRLWFEVNQTSVEYHNPNIDSVKSCSAKWYPYNKGGDFRKWYGNNDYLINWENDGKEIKEYGHLVPRSLRYQFFESGSWNKITSGTTAFRYKPVGTMFDVGGLSFFPYKADDLKYLIALCNSVYTKSVLKMISPTLNCEAGHVSSIPVIMEKTEVVKQLSSDSIMISKSDWDSFETSWDFKVHPLIRLKPSKKEDRHVVNSCGDSVYVSPVEYAYTQWMIECDERFEQLKANEEELNRIFIDIYSLQDELSPEVEDKDVTVRKADLQREIKSLISYAVGCMFGRYSLDTEGLAYAGGEWDSEKYKSFIPDNDNIIPICDDEYFEDDIVHRFVEFIKVAYGEDTLEENLQFIAGALGGTGTPREIIRNYFINDFFKDHCNTYQVTGSGKRPIYWQFDSGKKNGFKALMYIHRYTPDLIARMRTSYIHELQSKYTNQISMTERQVESATSTSERVKIQKRLTKLKEQETELRKYEELVHHWADRMEPMDLDDGVKVNYARFQELLTKIK